ncbi:DUF4837 family protein [Thermoflexibacter ruber]|uniref:DUF4837 domain-containing protein n=1 Tax=Thermoflexibacter ruber TaxID=1003 RepID=A0A1I2HXM6_9BACT|nr:DUF4837 family protein [Thermoflexibacter ruber]SFF34622.1 protein of unknown function [Thermoflexibacter ruber]
MKYTIAFMKLCLLAFTAIFLFACSMERSAENGNLVPSRGDSGEILLFMDSTKWEGELGKAVREVFSARLAGTLREERIFTLRYINPLALNDVLKSHRNIVMVTSLESSSKETRKLKSFYTEESLKTIEQTDSLFMLLKYEQFAKDQILLFLFSKTDQGLIKQLKANKERLQEIFNSAEVRRLSQRLYKAKEQTNISKQITEKHGFKVRIPFGYEQVVNEKSTDGKEGFLWHRLLDPEIDKSFFVAYKPYENQNQFEKDSIISWRNQICKKYLYGDPDNKESYVVTETLEPPVSKPLMVKGRYTMETRGLWKTNNISMGGSFISYVFTDNKKGRIYYAEGFVYAPSKMTKREYIRELQVILTSIE